MGSITKRQQCRRRLAALSFLSNISLDGTHRDTKLGIYNLSLQTDSSKLTVLDAKEDILLASGDYSWRNSSYVDLNTVHIEADDKVSEVLHSSSASPRERVHSFVSETKSKFLSQRKKNVAQEYRSVTACSSNESIGVSNTRQNTLTDPYEMKFLRSPKVFRNERVVLLSQGKIPFLVYSSLSYDKNTSIIPIRNDSKLDGNRKRQISGSTRALSAINDDSDPLNILSIFGFAPSEEGQDISYGCFLTSGTSTTHRKCRPLEADHLAIPCPHINRCHSFDPSVSNVISTNKQPTTPTSFTYERGAEFIENKHCHHSACMTYTPNLLDDPELVTGKHSTVLTFSSYITSIIDYVKPSDLKKELNEKFKERFPHIHLTLSKLRSLKREMFKTTHLECGIDLLTLAQAYVFFEKLILKGLINKHNRKLCAAACVLLSAKLNDVKGQDLKTLIEKLECGFRLSHKDLIMSEFRVLVALEFSLHLPTWEVFPHYQRLLYES